MKWIILAHLLAFGFIFPYAQEYSNLQSDIDSIFQNYTDKPGCAVAVLKGDKTIFQKGYGLANLSYNVPVTTETVFNVTSLAHQITAASIYLLEQEGKLKLDDLIQDYLPDFPVYEHHPITIRHLLYQTSGLRSYYATLHSKGIYWGDDSDNDDVINVLKKHKGLNFPSGTRHHYTFANYSLLASIVEKAGGESFANFTREHIFDPLGMSQTHFRQERDAVIKNLAIGYEEDDGHFRKSHFFNNTIVGDGGLFTTIEDFAQWSKIYYRGFLGSMDLIRKIMTPGTLSNGTSINYANGLHHGYHYDLKDIPRVFESGHWSGFRSLHYQLPKQGVTIILLTNNSNIDVWMILDELLSLFLDDEIEKAQKAMSDDVINNVQPLSLSKAQKEKFCGSFYSTLNGYLREIKLHDEQLVYIRPGASPVPLVALSSNELIYENTPQVKFTYDKSSFDSWTVTINNIDPKTYQKYEKVTYSYAELKQFENSYYNEDMEETFQIVALEKDIQVLVKGEELVRLIPVSEDLFTSDHWGYIVFDRNARNEVTGYTRYDDHLHGLKHTVEETDRSESDSSSAEENEEIRSVLLDYIEGTGKGQPDRVRRAFHRDLNLYSVRNDSLHSWNGKDYIGSIKTGEINKREGKILYVDVEKDAAIAKVEIKIPDWRVFTDYFLLLKLNGSWEIIHKSYTWREISRNVEVP